MTDCVYVPLSGKGTLSLTRTEYEVALIPISPPAATTYYAGPRLNQSRRAACSARHAGALTPPACGVFNQAHKLHVVLYSTVRLTALPLIGRRSQSSMSCGLHVAPLSTKNWRQMAPETKTYVATQRRCRKVSARHQSETTDRHASEHQPSAVLTAKLANR